MGIFAELKRRNVIRIAVAYLAGCWVLVQVAETLFPVYEIPDSIIRLMVPLLVIGFPVALILAWIFELTPEGIRRESEVDRSQSSTRQSGQQLNRVITLMLLTGVVFFAVDKFVLDPQRDAELAQAAAEQARKEVRAEVEQEVLERERAGNSIAVLPFRDMSAAGDQQYFSDGISEELLNALVRVDGLMVASRTSSFVYRDDAIPVTVIAEELQVNHVLEGSVRKAGDRVRITAQLIDAHTDRHLWSDTYDRELNDVLAVQAEIATAIVEAMKSELDLQMGEVRIAAETDSADAYDLYLKGRALIIARSDLYTAIEALERSIEIDPEFAKAWEVLGAAYYIAPSWGYSFDFDAMQRSWEAAERALQLDSRLALALAVKASVGQITGRHSYAVEIDMKRQAISLDPKSATVHLWLALSLSDLGFVDEAVKSVHDCLDIDPRYENCRRHLANMEYERGNNELALELFFEGAENGFSGNAALLIPLMVAGGRRDVAALTAVNLVIDQSFPVRDLLDILEDPSGPHEAARQRVLKQVHTARWNNDASKSMVGVIAGDFEQAEKENWDTFMWLWSPALSEFRQSDVFRRLVISKGMLNYWQERGFPPRCQDLGNGNFSCN